MYNSIIDFAYLRGGFAEQKDEFLIEGSIPRYAGYQGRHQWIHFAVYHVPRAIDPERYVPYLESKWKAGWLVGIVHSPYQFERLFTIYRYWLNAGSQGFFSQMLPDELMIYKELYRLP